ncbi:MAG TPA: aminomethyltransferase beta-barrel domain-containing protein, partial [Actinopolymorphaceae bacterium]
VVSLLEPAMGVAPGQAVVLYDGTRVVGSATIASTGSAVSAR